MHLQNAIFPCDLCHTADSQSPPCLTHSPYLHQKTKSALGGKIKPFTFTLLEPIQYVKLTPTKGT